MIVCCAATESGCRSEPGWTASPVWRGAPLPSTCQVPFTCQATLEGAAGVICDQREGTATVMGTRQRRTLPKTDRARPNNLVGSIVTIALAAMMYLPLIRRSATHPQSYSRVLKISSSSTRVTHLHQRVR